MNYKEKKIRLQSEVSQQQHYYFINYIYIIISYKCSYNYAARHLYYQGCLKPGKIGEKSDFSVNHTIAFFKDFLKHNFCIKPLLYPEKPEGTQVIVGSI